MPGTPLLVASIAGTALAALQLARRRRDEREAEAAWARLRDAPPRPGRFDAAMVAELPEPARRFLRFAILPGARLATVVEIAMDGELSLGTRDDPGYRPMQAEQILAAPQGLVWRVRIGSGLLRVSGSDGLVGDRSWTRFWMLGTVPVVRAGGDADHLRSSFGRAIAEAAFWAPASLLPGPGIAWTEVDADTARVTVTRGDLSQQVDIRVDAEGRPSRVGMQRWTDANPQRVFRLQPFGGELSDFRPVDGFRIPHRVDGGNFFGTPDYFPFYRARLTSVRFP
ncbi:MAG TPA: DUF6544 family protein [Burkholderiaceae bacterium]|nr:DUF6544 family protein [Burkholderiaceae bacterium]